MKTRYFWLRTLSCIYTFILFTHLAVANINEIAFALYCPDDVTVDCDAEIWDLSIYGNATYHDHNGYHDAGSPVVKYYLNSCGGGYITRKWVVEDPYWNNHSCTQYIYIGSGTGFNGNSIVWPAMYVAEGCNPNVHPDVTGYPTWVPSECSMIGYNYTDKLYTVSADCKKILRKWTIIDWCQANNGGNNYYSWTFTQTIKIVENTPPNFICIADITVTANDCKWGKVTASPLVVDPTTCGGNYDISNNSPYATEKKADLSGTYPVGTTKVIFTVKYACGSKKTCTVNVTVKPKAPTAICIGSLTVALMGMDTNNDGINDEGMVQIWAKDLNWKSETKCGYGPLRYSFSPDPNDMVKTFTCDHVGKNTVRMYVTDSKGGQTYCEVIIDIQNNGANIQDCDPIIVPPDTSTLSSKKYALSGFVKDINGEDVKDVQFELFNPNDIYKYVTKQVPGIALVRDSIRTQSGNWIWFYTEKEVIVTKIDTILIPDNIFKQRSKDNGVFAYDTIMTKDKTYMLKCIDKELAIQNIDKNDIDILTAFLIDNSVFTETWQYLAADVNRDDVIDINDLNLLIKYVKGEINVLNVDQWSLVYWTQEIDQLKAEILTKGNGWAQFEKVSTDIVDVEFKMIQVGNIDKEPHQGGNINEDFTAYNRNRNENSVVVYPNPFMDKMILQIGSVEEQNIQFTLTDLTGKLVENKTYQVEMGESFIAYDANTLNPGIYFYQIFIGETLLSGKILKSN